MNLAKRIEYAVTNGLGYNPVQTDFTRNDPKTYFFKQPLEESDIIISRHAVKAHLAHLEQRISRSLVSYLSNSLRNSHKGHFFKKADGSSDNLSDKERRRVRKRFVREINYFERTMNSEISSAQTDAKMAVLKSGKDLGKIIMPYMMFFSDRNRRSLSHNNS